MVEKEQKMMQFWNKNDEIWIMLIRKDSVFISYEYAVLNYSNTPRLRPVSKILHPIPLQWIRRIEDRLVKVDPTYQIVDHIGINARYGVSIMADTSYRATGQKL
nr:hypothetical protein [Tanacetum cinerariifolium]